MKNKIVGPIGQRCWQGRLRDQYGSKEEIFAYCEIYNNQGRLGYASPESAWRANPLIQGSVRIMDYRRVQSKCIQSTK